MMNELLATLGGLIAALGSAQSTGALKEHVALLNAKMLLIKEHLENLEEENADLKKRNAEMAEQLMRQQSSAEFVEARGALFKRLPNGGYRETPYCPQCHRSLSCDRHMHPYQCSNRACGHLADFKGNQLHDVLSSLPP